VLDPDLHAELKRLAERFPTPDPAWHRFVPEIHEVIRDLFVALDAVAALPGAQAALVQHIENDAAPPDEDAGGPALAAARRRLRDLPAPQGEHPYLDEIQVTLEAADALLSALAAAGGEAEFARLQDG
jgi:hypothetical protein